MTEEDTHQEADDQRGDGAAAVGPRSGRRQKRRLIAGIGEIGSGSVMDDAAADPVRNRESTIAASRTKRTPWGDRAQREEQMPERERPSTAPPTSTARSGP